MPQLKFGVATRKIGSKWHAAVISDNAFMQSLIESDLETLVHKALEGVLTNDRPEGTTVNLDIMVTPPGEAPSGSDTQK
jgi:hypothetical protein